MTARPHATGRSAARAIAPAPLLVRDLGAVPYARAWALQKELVAERTAGRGDDVLLVCEHDPVVTVGRGAGEGFLLDDRFEVVAVERGGAATYHGPGQIVVYPIVALRAGRRDLHAWLRALEQAVVDALGAFGLAAGRVGGATGVWVGGGTRKIASIGVAASRWVTWHGLALNHRTDLDAFAAIRPCGFSADVMTSLERECAAAGLPLPARARVVAGLVARLQVELEPFRADGETASR